MATTTGDAQRGQDMASTSMAVPQSGWQLFAGIMLLFNGIWIAFESMIAFFHSTYFIGGAVFGSLWIWALAWLVFGLLMIGAGGAVMTGQSWGRWFGVVVVSLAAFVHLASFATYPWWSAVSITIDGLILFGLTARWQEAGKATY